MCVCVCVCVICVCVLSVVLNNLDKCELWVQSSNIDEEKDDTTDGLDLTCLRSIIAIHKLPLSTDACVRVSVLVCLHACVHMRACVRV